MNYFYMFYPLDLYTKYIYYKKVMDLCTIMLDKTVKRVYNRTIVIPKGNIYPPSRIPRISLSTPASSCSYFPEAIRYTPRFN